MRIAQITLATSDPAAQADFWADRLGLPVRMSDGAAEVLLQRSTVRFEPAAAGVDPRYHFAINVPRGSIEAAAAWLGARHEVLEFRGDPEVDEGATIVQGDRGASSFYFLDGGGNVVELMANPRVAEKLEGPFGAASLLEIAEIGVATADAPATRRNREALRCGRAVGRTRGRAPDRHRRRPRSRDRRAGRARLDSGRPTRAALADDDRRRGSATGGGHAAGRALQAACDLVARGVGRLARTKRRARWAIRSGAWPRSRAR